jgi:hypothetical protein
MINWKETGSFGGTSLQGYLKGDFKAQKVALKLASGQSGTERAGDKTTVEFVGTCNGKPFTLYDYKGDREFHVGGNRDLDLVQLGRDLSAFGTVESARF